MIQAWQAYNRQIAEKNKLVAHGRPSADNPAVLRNSFFRNNNFQEMEAAQISSIHSPYIVCGELAGKPAGVELVRKKTIKTRLYFLAHVAESLDNLEAVQEMTFDVMMEVISRYKYDSEEYGACGPFRRLDINKMFWREVGPIKQWEYGWLLDMEFQEDGNDFNYDPSKWFD
jgi:hypothetical protein